MVDHSRVVGYYLDDTLSLYPPPMHDEALSYLKKKRRQLYEELLKDFYRSSPLGFDPPEHRFHVVTYCRLDVIRPVIRGWLHRHLGDRVASLTFINADFCVQNLSEMTAAAVTRYAMTDYVTGDTSVLRSLDLKLPNPVRLYGFSSDKQKEPYLRRYNKRKTDGP